MAQNQTQPAQSPSAAPSTHAQPAEMRERMMEMREQRMAQMQQQQMREMQPAIDAMRRKVSLLGSELLSVQDVNTRRALQTDMELWQQLLETMQRHMQSMGMQDHMMPPMPGPGMPPPANTPPKSPQPQPQN
jgi:hypothetical protein